MSYQHRLLTNLRVLLVAYATHKGLSAATVTSRVLGDPKFATRLETGGDFRVGTYDRAVEAFSDVWPDDLPWPDSIDRPETMRRSA